MANAIISVVLVAFFRLRIRGSAPILERTIFFLCNPFTRNRANVCYRLQYCLPFNNLYFFSGPV